MKRMLPVLLAPIVLLAAAAPAGATVRPAAKARSPLAEYRLALADAATQSSVQWVLQYTGAFHELLTTNDGLKSGSQAMLVVQKGVNGYANEELLPDGTAYLKGTAVGLSDGVGLTAASASSGAGSWWAFTKKTPNYLLVADGLTVAASAKDIRYSVDSKQPGLAYGTPTVFGGHGLAGGEPVLVIKHIATSVLGTETLYVSEGATPLPVELKIPSLHQTYTYTWGANVTPPTAPTGAFSGKSLTFAASSSS